MKKELLNNSKIKFINLLFPLYPINVFKSTILISVLAMLISIRILMQFFTIPIPQFGMSLSISHIPLMIIGWLFGPIIGFFTGIVTDTICYFAKPTSPWFWLYAIQEPILGMISGFFGSIYLIFNSKKNYKLELILSKIILYFFVFFSLIIILIYANNSNPFQGSNNLDDNNFFTIYKYVSISVIILFAIIYEISFFYISNKNKEYKRKLLYIGNLVFINAIFFSFLLGTISIVEYNKIFFPENNNFIKYGAMFYVIPRVIKESIKTPIQIILMFSIILSINPLFNKLLNDFSVSWKKKN